MQPWKFKKQILQREALAAGGTTLPSLLGKGRDDRCRQCEALQNRTWARDFVSSLCTKRIIQRVSNRYNLNKTVDGQGKAKQLIRVPDRTKCSGVSRSSKRSSRFCQAKFFKRVWSWLRMNAGGVPNTCKSNGVVSLKRFRSILETT